MHELPQFHANFGTQFNSRFVDRAALFHTRVFRTKVLLKRFWWVFILTFSLSIGYQIYLEQMREPSYVSSARMIVSGRISLPDGGVYNEELTHWYGTQMTLMVSPAVKRRAKVRVAEKRPELKPVPVRLRADQQRSTSIFVLTTESPEPKYAQAFLDAAMDSYMSLRREMRSKTSAQTLQQITDELLSVEEEIAQGQKDLIDFQEKNNIFYIQEEVNSANAYRAELVNQIAELKTQLKIIDGLLRSASDTEEPDDSFLSLTSYTAGEGFRALRQKLNELRAQRDEFSIYMRPKHPKIYAFNREIERTENLLEIARRQEIDLLREKRHALEQQVKSMETSLQDSETVGTTKARVLTEYERLKSNLEHSNRLYERLISSTRSIDLNRSIDQERFVVLENASDAVAETPNRLGQGIKAAIMGLLLGVGLLFLFGFLDNRIISVEDLTYRFDQPVLAVVPLERKTVQGKVELLKQKDPRFLFAEAVRNMRSFLMMTDSNDEVVPAGEPAGFDGYVNGRRSRTILVTSSLPGEGKSTLTGNLATTLGFAANRTLLVDADLRRGNLHNLLGIERGRGLSDLIQEDLPLEDVIQKTNVENMDFVSCGECTQKSGELLLSARMNRFLHEVKERYDYIVFDSAPIMATDDTTSFAARVDTLLFVARSSFTPAQQINAAIERLNLRGAKVAAFILNGVNTRNPVYYYYNKYSNYYAADAPRQDAPRPELKL